jgi:hypothetical protein
MLEQHSDIYRITAAMKGKTDIIINIAASPIGRALMMYVETFKTALF